MNSLQKLCLNTKSVVIFDMDGTLIDSIGIWNHTDEQLLRHFGACAPSLMQIQQERDAFLAHHADTDIYLAYCAYLKEKYVLAADPADMLARRWEISGQYLRTQVDYKPQAELVLQALKKAGKRLALATVTTRVQLQIYEQENVNLRRKARLGEMFDLIISKEDIVHKKPHPEIYQKVMAHFDAAPQECLVFEDSYLGVLAAKNAGIEVVNVYDAYAKPDQAKIDSLADYQIETYQEFLDTLCPSSSSCFFKENSV